MEISNRKSKYQKKELVIFLNKYSIINIKKLRHKRKKYQKLEQLRMKELDLEQLSYHIFLLRNFLFLHSHICLLIFSWWFIIYNNIYRMSQVTGPSTKEGEKFRWRWKAIRIPPRKKSNENARKARRRKKNKRQTILLSIRINNWLKMKNGSKNSEGMFEI